MKDKSSSSSSPKKKRKSFLKKIFKGKKEDKTEQQTDTENKENQPVQPAESKANRPPPPLASRSSVSAPASPARRPVKRAETNASASEQPQPTHNGHPSQYSPSPQSAGFHSEPELKISPHLDQVSYKKCEAGAMTPRSVRSEATSVDKKSYVSTTSGFDFNRIYTSGYITGEKDLGYLKRGGTEPRAPPSQHFHRPVAGVSTMSLPSYIGVERRWLSLNSARSYSKPVVMHFHRPTGTNFSYRTKSKITVPCKKGLVSTLGAGDPRRLRASRRSSSPAPINNDEPLRLSQFPSGVPPDPSKPPKIERLDWPSPPYAAAVPELRKRHRSLQREESDDTQEDAPQEDLKLKRDIEEISKMGDSGLAKVIAADLKEKGRRRSTGGVDPRSASRTPSAKIEPHQKPRYESPVNASPSRVTDHPRPFADDQYPYSPVGYRRTFALPKHDSSHSVFERTPEAAGSRSLEPEGDHHALVTQSRHSNSKYGGSFSAPTDTAFSRSEPNLNGDTLQPYPYDVLRVERKSKLPPEVDRQRLECHLADDEFKRVFEMSRSEFYQLPDWKRVELKKKAHLF